MYCRRQTIIPLLLGCILFLSSVRLAAAQTPPSPPAAVIAEAQRFAQIAGRTLSGPPLEARMEIDPRTGHAFWVMDWQPETGNLNRVSVTVDEQTEKAVEYKDGLVSASDGASNQAGEVPSVTQDQAIAKLDVLLAGLPATPGDWRNMDAELKIYNNGGAYWIVGKRRYFDQKPVFPGSSIAFISPYTS